MSRKVEVIECSECRFAEFSRSITCAYRCCNKSAFAPARGRTVMPDYYCPVGENKEGKSVKYID
jgi:hypothetical protein